VTLSNSGTVTLNISSIAITAGNSFFAISSNTCKSTLGAGKKCTVKVTFTPTALSAETGTLTFTDDATGSPQTVSLSGTGVAQATLTPARYTFPKTKVGTTSAAKKFTLMNNLATTLTGISYSTNAPFAVSTATCTTTLASKKSCTISVTFSPTATGIAAGTLTVNDSANSSPQTASLSGTGD
jgi:Abnormal spindle-like microcephaly-assoc'd, ASPM-SPD-2-Hydin